MTKAKKLILKAADALGIKITSMEWTPIGRGAEMQGPSGGWEVESAIGVHYGYNVEQVIENMTSDAAHERWRRAYHDGYKHGVANAAKDKDEQIARLERALATGGDLDARFRALNKIKASVICDFFGAVWETAHGSPYPVNWNFVMQEVAKNALGEDWQYPVRYEPPAIPINFQPIPEPDREKFYIRSRT